MSGIASIVYKSFPLFSKCARVALKINIYCVPRPQSPPSQRKPGYNIAATPAATAPMIISPFEMTFEVPALPVGDELEPLPVALGVPEPDALLLVLPESSVAAPKIPPWTVSGDEPEALDAADLYAARVLPLDLCGIVSIDDDMQLNRRETLTEGSQPWPCLPHNVRWLNSTATMDPCR
jgi:hypothetical protein